MIKPSSLIAAATRVCRLPLAAIVSPDLNATDAGNPLRLIASPVAPIVLYTRETLACMGIISASTPATGDALYFPPPQPFGVSPDLVRVPRVMVVVYGNLSDDDPLLDELAIAHAASLAPLGVHLFVTTGGYVHPPPDPVSVAIQPALESPLAAVGILDTVARASLDAFSENRYSGIEPAAMSGGEVLWLTLSTDPYGLAIPTHLTSGVYPVGYATYEEEERPQGNTSPFNDIPLGDYVEYAQVTTGSVSDVNGRSRVRVLRSVTKAAQDLAIMTGYADRCSKFRFTFYTGEYATRANGESVPGSPGGLMSLIAGSSPYVTRAVLPTTPVGSSDLIDTTAAVTAIVADAAAFFTTA